MYEAGWIVFFKRDYLETDAKVKDTICFYQPYIFFRGEAPLLRRSSLVMNISRLCGFLTSFDEVLPIYQESFFDARETLDPEDYDTEIVCPLDLGIDIICLTRVIVECTCSILYDMITSALRTYDAKHQDVERGANILYAPTQCALAELVHYGVFFSVEYSTGGSSTNPVNFDRGTRLAIPPDPLDCVDRQKYSPVLSLFSVMYGKWYVVQ
jgi:hypothetical protein